MSRGEGLRFFLANYRVFRRIVHLFLHISCCFVAAASHSQFIGVFDACA